MIAAEPFVNCHMSFINGRTANYFSFENGEKPFISIADNNEAISETLKEKEVSELSSNTSDVGGVRGI